MFCQRSNHPIKLLHWQEQKQQKGYPLELLSIQGIIEDYPSQVLY